MYFLTTMVCYKAIVCSLFTVLIELEHLCSTTFRFTKSHKMQDAELHFITYKFFFNKQMNPFSFFSNHRHQHIVDVCLLLLLPLLPAAENARRQKL